MSFRSSSELLFRSCLGPLGEVVRYQSQDQDERELQGILSQAYVLVREPGFESEISSSQPIFEIQEADLDFRPKLQDRLTIGESHFKVVNLEPNYQGQIKLHLKKIEKGLL